MAHKILFIDRDGTIIEEPADYQIDSLSKFKLKPHVIPALLNLQQAGYRLVMVTNQDGLGTAAFSYDDFNPPQQLLLDILSSQGIIFDEVAICPHLPSDHCLCRKPQLGLVMHYLKSNHMDFDDSCVIGDRSTDQQLANNMGIKGILYKDTLGWLAIAQQLTTQPRIAPIDRITKETTISGSINLDQLVPNDINTGIGFFDHMLEQLAKHGGFSLILKVQGDLIIDEHHTVEDTALAIGQALRRALGNKAGIARYGFLLPMDEALAHVAIDLSSRSFFVFEGQWTRERIGELPTELITHFFHSFADSLGAALHIKVTGVNNHHMVESIFKGVGRALRPALMREGHAIPSTKGIL